MDLSAMLQRVVRAVTFDLKFYNEAETDVRLNTEALTVVLIASLLSAIGAIWGGIGAIIGAFLLGVVGYYALAYIAYLVGTNFFGGQATIDKLLRPLGYAMAPTALGVFGIIPCASVPIVVIGGLWAVACSFVAIREAMELDTGKAALTTAAGFALWWIVWGILTWIF